ncbi:hypothetical protein LCGC14_0375730 [marine sediment metagenome]|uniref:Bacteriophage head to tail connecting protein n=1 Tax=marine sediment metagenome TaxID=412755 RepID=A0A0F9T3N7_9ZZZZ
MSVNIDEVLLRYNDAVSRRTKYNTIMQEAGQYAWPNAQDMVRNANQTEALLRTAELYDSTALMGAYRMTSGIFSYLMPVGVMWHEFVPQIHELAQDPTMQQWLSIARALSHKEIWRSNFQREMFITIRSMIVFGTGVISVEKIGDEIIFKSHHIGYIFLDENNRGEIDTVYRQIFYTARQALQEFGKVNLGKSINKAIKAGKLDEKFEFVHVVAPNQDFDSSKMGSKSKRIKSVYINIPDRVIVKEGGFDELPYLVARFSLAPQEIMGRGPVIEYLPEIKMLNRMKKSFIESAEKAVNPPLIVEDDGVIGQPVTSPGGMIYVRAGAMKPEPLNTGTNVALNAEIILQQQNVVKEGLFNDLFQALADHRNMTAFETASRIEESIVMIAPAITSLQKEIFSPLITRVLNLLIKAKRIPEPPVSFDFDIVYQGRLALAMSNLQTNAMEATLAKWAPYAQVSPVFDNVGWDVSFRTSWLNSGAPAEGLKDQDLVDAERAEIKELQKAAAQAEIAAEASKAYRNVNEAPVAGSIAEGL